MAVETKEQVVPDREELLKRFIESCSQKGLLARPDSLEERDSAEGLLDQPTLLRFLTARKFDHDEAIKHFEEVKRFREENQIIRLYDLVQVADFENARRLYFHWTGRRDKKGLPLCFYDLDYLTKDVIAGWEKTRTVAQWKYSQSDTKPPSPNMLQLAAAYVDSVSRFVIPLCSMMPDRPEKSTPITSSLYLVDATNMGLKQAWSAKNLIQDISWLLSTCFPESIDKVLVCNSPSYFPTIWKYLKPYVDPFTAEKIVFLLRSEVLPTLREYIDDANIPAQFGGAHSFTHGQLPDLEDEIKKCLGLQEGTTQLPPGPIKWIEEADGRKSALAVGSEAGSERNHRVATMDSRQ
ncbi:unnamed protein product [Penicillium olsonii]|nr:unnamed protein product [Penicillium olsonii]